MTQTHDDNFERLPQTLVDLLRQRAQTYPHKLAYSFLPDGESEEARFTYAQLDQAAQAVASRLQQHNATGQRAVLLYPPGLDFIAAFFGCLYAGVTAVPVYAPRLNRPDPRIQGIVTDSQARFALTTSKILENITQRFEQAPELAALHWLNTEETPAGTPTWLNPHITADTLAFLQYTSGSTGDPKGVMVSHGNLLANLAMISHGFQIKPDSIGVFWLPSYHDMGLIGGLLTPMYVASPSFFMPPAAFLQRPIRWLQAITDHRGTISGAPNFAYQLCVDKITPEECANLDLSSWHTAFCGAEPVRPETLAQFAAKFAPYGFSPDAFYPTYGLAEATLIVAGGEGPARPVTFSLHRPSLAQNQIVPAHPTAADSQTLISCGQALLNETLSIVHPDTRTLCPPDQVGEIWVSGPNVAQGYWSRPGDTAATFQAHLDDTGHGPYLRTGDLGFIHDGQLYITGRVKDLIIIRGRNHYPQDIEHTIESCHPALAPGMGAAFSCDIDGEERLIITYELTRSQRKADINEVASAIRQAIATKHELQTYAILLLKPMSIPKTSSGKIRRYACQQGFLDGSLDVIGQWQQTQSPSHQARITHHESHSAPQITHWLRHRLATELQITPDSIDTHQPFNYYGLDSAQAVSLSGELERWLGRSLEPTLVWDYPTIAQLAAYLANDQPAAPDSQPQPHHQPPAGNQHPPIAIIGLGCRFPGADSPDAFWQLLHSGSDAIRQVPPGRWDADTFYSPERATPGKTNTRAGGFLDNIDQFDPLFFGISPREASRIDPQQRLLLEVAWEALEHAGQAPGRVAHSSTGVFIGISSYDYARDQFNNPADIDAYAGTGNAHSIAANRISYILDLHGPSLAIDTACSSSLVAIHQAIHSLQRGESDLALAGGVNLILVPDLTIFFSQARALADDGRCKAFDARADGYVRSEGCGLVVLKRLDDARRDGDNILAVLYGSAVNQDGRTNGLTAPNGHSQQAVIRHALANAGLPPAGISYIEAHGTGTPLGDPIELHALRAVYDENRPAGQPYHVGSVKTNIGHLEAAAGIASLIKVVLALQHQAIPPHLHFQSLNPYINLDGSQLTIPTQSQPWPATTPRLAGISSFGFGGTNAHLILGDAPEQPAGHRPPAASDALQPAVSLLALSAPSPESLRETARRYTTFLANTNPADLPHIAYTSHTGRDHHPYRLTIPATHPDQLRDKLTRFASRPAPLQPPPATGHKIAFLYTGSGSQYPGMGQQLYQTSPVFRAAINQCAGLLRPHLDLPLLDILYPNETNANLVHQIAYAQPALFAVEYALTQLWAAWGITPDLVIGHSTGEYIAATVAGILSLADGLALIATRARLMHALPPNGSMANLYTNPGRAQTALAPYHNRLAIAAINGPENVVISGDRAAVDAVLAQLAAEGIAGQTLAISQAAHSPLIEPMLDSFSTAASQVTFHPPRIPLVTNLTGRLIPPHETPGLAHWQQHLRQPVQFAAGIDALASAGATIFLEIGPQPTLLALGRRCLSAEQQANTLWLPSLRQKRDDWQVMLDSLGQLYEAGLTIDWDNFHRPYRRHKLPLPTTPFQRERYWFTPTAATPQNAAPRPGTTPHRLPTALPIYEWTPPDPAGDPANTAQQLLHAAATDLFGPGAHQIQVWTTPAGTTYTTYQAALTLQSPTSATAQLFGQTAPAAGWTLLGGGQLLAGQPAAAPPLAPAQAPAPAEAPAPEEEVGLGQQLRTAEPAAAQALAEAYLHNSTAAVMGLPPERLPVDRPLDSLGLDSLMAIELKSRLEKEAGVSLPMVKFLEGPTVAQLAAQLVAYLATPAGTADPAALPPLQPVSPATGPHPLSYNQQALWFLHELLPAGLSFNVAGAVHLHGQLNADALRAAFAALYQRHASLRLTFRLEAARPVQQISSHAPLPFFQQDATHWDEDTVHSYLQQQAYKPFDLARGPILRLELLTRPGGSHILLLAMDHIIVDLWSISLMIQELLQLYLAELAGQPAALPALDYHYTDFVHWETALVNSPAGTRMRDYWLNQLAGELPALNLPTDHPRPATQTYNGDTVSLRLSANLAQRLTALGQAHGATLYVTLLAAFQALLHRYSGQDDLIVGTVLSGRDQPELANVIGYCINPLAMRADFSQQPTFAQFLAQVRQKVLGAIDHQHYPLPLLADQLHFHRDPSRPPIFETMFIMQKAQIQDGQPLSAFAPGMPDARLELAGLTLTSLPLPGMPAQFDLTLMVADMADGLGASLHYNTGLFDTATMQRMLAHFATLLEQVAANPHRAISTIPLLPENERRQLLAGWNATQATYPAGQCLHQLISAQARRTPQAIAVTGRGTTLTYAQLDRQSDQLAAYLRRQGVGPEHLVGIGVARTPHMLVGLLGILKAGGAYVPLDPAFPAERLTLMLDDAQPRLLLTDRANCAAFQQTGVPRLLCLDEDWPEIAAAGDTPPPAGTTPHNLAYVIYTSGSTGRPKGVMISHRAVVNFLNSMATRPGLTATDTLLAVTTLSFDIAVLELYLPLLVGGTVVIASREQAADGQQLATLLAESGATVMQATPATWQMLLAAGWQPAQQKLLCGGEALPADLARQLRQNGAELWNMYGPTETTVWSTTDPVTGDDTITIGRPIDNTQVYILDNHLQPVPVGVVGDLYLGGDGIARGYLNRPGLTATRFVPNPFTGGTFYRTGDKARYLPDGRLIFLGRDDYQVKVRGFRIELGDIEAALSQLPALAATPAGARAVVTAHEARPGENQLVAYLVTPPGTELPPAGELRHFLRQHLPDYMMPAYFVPLDSLPLTPNGKVNRRALPPPPQARPELLADYTPPQTPQEQTLARLVADVLALEKVGRHDSFFDLGGNSLLATRLIFQVNEQFKVQLPLRHLFAEPTVAGLSKALDSVRPTAGGLNGNGHAKPGLFGHITLETLQADAVLPPDITAGLLLPRANHTDPAHVFLTGATGFVGAFLLYDLLQHTRATVHCLVRADDIPAGEERLRQNMLAYGLWDEALLARIVVVPGDLARPRFGLPIGTFWQLARQIDVIYHNGAMVNFVYTYHTHKGANVLGTQEVLRLATRARLKAVHFVSTLSVLHSGHHDDGTTYYEDIPLDKIGLPFGGYAQSKWVAEKLLDIARQRGIPVAVYRPGLIGGHSRRGTTNTADLMSTLSRACVLLGAVPDLDVMVDIVPVDYVSRAIVHLSLQPGSFGQTFHLAAPQRWPYRELVNWVRAQGFSLELLPYESWRDRLLSLARQFGGGEWGAFLPLLEEAEPDQIYLPAFDCRNALAGLDGSDIVCPPVGPELLANYLAYFVAQGWLVAS